MTRTLNEAVLNKLSKPDLVQSILNIEANLDQRLLKRPRKSKTCQYILKNLRQAWLLRQFWENAQYSKRGTLDVLGLPTSLRYNFLDQKLCDVFQEIGVDICDRDIQAKSSERQRPNNGQIYQQKRLPSNSEDKKTIE